MYTFLLRMTDTMASQNIDLSSWDTPYVPILCGRLDASCANSGRQVADQTNQSIHITVYLPYCPNKKFWQLPRTERRSLFARRILSILHGFHFTSFAAVRADNLENAVSCARRLMDFPDPSSVAPISSHSSSVSSRLSDSALLFCPITTLSVSIYLRLYQQLAICNYDIMNYMQKSSHLLTQPTYRTGTYVLPMCNSHVALGHQQRDWLYVAGIWNYTVGQAAHKFTSRIMINNF
jgi:hypothetical protein